MPSATVRSEKLDLRVSPEAKRALRRAADASRQSLSEFVLASALQRAEEMLAEQTSLPLSAEAWAAFTAALDAPPRELPRLQRLLDEPGVFDR